MDFKTTAKLCSYIARDYAEDFFRLISFYKDISASEAASRLNLHIQTAQDFLDGLASLGVLKKEEVYEGKRPYFRYALKQKKVHIEMDFSVTVDSSSKRDQLQMKIKEKRGSGAKFTTGSSGSYLSSITIWTGKERNLKERKINLTVAQGQFLFHLPFPDAELLSFADIMKKSGVESEYEREVLDIVNFLEENGIIECEHSIHSDNSEDK